MTISKPSKNVVIGFIVALTPISVAVVDHVFAVEDSVDAAVAETFQLEGTIVGAPEGARISLLPPDEIAPTTDVHDRGEFSFSAVPKGTYSLQILDPETDECFAKILVTVTGNTSDVFVPAEDRGVERIDYTVTENTP